MAEALLVSPAVCDDEVVVDLLGVFVEVVVWLGVRVTAPE